MGRGWSLYNWREQNIEWIHKWENEALVDIVHQLRYILCTLFFYDDHTMREDALLSSQGLCNYLILQAVRWKYRSSVQAVVLHEHTC